MPNSKMEMLDLINIADEIIAGGKLQFDQAVRLARFSEIPSLMKAANKIRKTFHGRMVETCSIMNAKSGKCSENCKWCAQSGHYRTGVQTYGYVSANAAYLAASYAKNNKVQRFSLVTSGRSVSDSDVEKLALAYERMKTIGGLSLCGSFGLLNKRQLQRLKDAGITRYHCNLETAPSKFPELCTTHTITDKLETIRAAKEIGLEICCGGIIGMGETLEQRIELAFAIAEIEPASIPVNILQPIKGTPLETNGRFPKMRYSSHLPCSNL